MNRTHRKFAIIHFLCLAVVLGSIVGDIAAQPSGAIKPTATELELLWSQLGSGDLEEGAAAVQAMAKTGAAAVEFIARELEPLWTLREQGIEDHLRRLDHDQFAAREAATRELIAAGRWVESPLRRAAGQHSLEVNSRIDRILRGMPDSFAGNENDRRWRRAAEVLDLIGGDKALEIRPRLASFEKLSVIDPRVFQLLKQLDSTDPDVLGDAATKLCDFGVAAKPAVAKLIDLLADTRQSKIPNGSTQLASRVEAGLRKLGSIATDPLVSAMLTHPKRECRLKVVEIVKDLKDPRTISALVTVLRNDERQIADQAAAALAATGAEGVPPLIAELSNPDASIRMHAARWLGATGNAQAVGPLIDALSDDHNDVALNAAMSLHNLGPASVEPLIAVLTNGPERARLHAVNSLNKLSDERAIEPLAALLGDRDANVRIAASDALSKLAKTSLFKTAYHYFPYAQVTESGPTAEELSRRRRVVDQLALVLDSEHDDSRIAAARTIHTPEPLAESRLLPGLKRCLEASNPAVRVEALRAINVFGLPGSVNVNHMSPQDFIRFGYETSTVVLDVFTRAIGDPNDEVRAAASSGVIIRAADARDKLRLVELLLPLLEDSNPVVRMNSVAALGRLNDSRDRRAVPHLMRVLQDSDTRVVLAAIESLGALKDPSATAAIVPFLSDPSSVTAAANALGQIGDRSALPSLRERLPEGQIAVIAAIGILRDRESIPELLRQLSANAVAQQQGAPPAADTRFNANRAADIERRAAVALALGKIGDPKTAPELCRQLREATQGHMGDVSGSSFVRALSDALAEIGDEQAVDELFASYDRISASAGGMFGFAHGQRTRPAIENSVFMNALRLFAELAPDKFLRALKSDSERIRQAAAYSLNYLRFRNGSLDAELKEALAAALNDNDPAVREYAAELLGANGDQRAGEKLFEIVFSDREEWRRSNACNYLVQVKNPAHVPRLIEKLSDENAAFRAAAARTLGLLKQADAFEPLSVRLTDSEPKVRATAADAIGRLSQPKGAELIVPLLKDDAALVRHAAATALGLLAVKTSADDIANLLADADREVALSASHALIKLGDERGYMRLASLLQIDDTGWREHVLDASMNYRQSDDRLAEVVSARLLDDSARVVRSAARILGWIGSEKAVDALLGVDEDSVTLRESVIAALSRCKDPRAIVEIIRWQDDPRPQIRAAVAHALELTNDSRREEALRRFLADANRDVRVAAVIAAGRAKLPGISEELERLAGDEDPQVRKRVRVFLAQNR